MGQLLPVGSKMGLGLQKPSKICYLAGKNCSSLQIIAIPLQDSILVANIQLIARRYPAVIEPLQNWFFCRNGMKMQNSTLPKFEISILKFLKNLVSGKWEIGTSKLEIRFWFWNQWIEIQNLFPKLKNLHLKISNLISILNFMAGNLIFKIPKSFSLFSLESQFETIKFEISDVENPQNLDFRFKIFIFASNFSSTKILILY